jgi:hypothetical protein
MWPRATPTRAGRQSIQHCRPIIPWNRVRRPDCARRRSSSASPMGNRLLVAEHLTGRISSPQRVAPFRLPPRRPVAKFDSTRDAGDRHGKPVPAEAAPRTRASSLLALAWCSSRLDACKSRCTCFRANGSPSKRRLSRTSHCRLPRSRKQVRALSLLRPGRRQCQLRPRRPTASTRRRISRTIQGPPPKSLRTAMLRCRRRRHCLKHRHSRRPRSP